MKKSVRRYNCQLAVIGSGLAGFAASVFALDRGIATAQVGSTGSVAYTTGYLDLLGYHRQRILKSPWEGLAQLRRDEPGHPLSRLDDGEIRQALERFTAAITAMGIAYAPPGEENLLALSPAGTLKPTCSVPRTMLSGVEACGRNAKTLIVDFTGLQGFSAKEFVANLRSSWPGLTAAHLGFPDMDAGGQVFPEVMARALEVATNRERLAVRLKAELRGAESIGMPAVMGVHAPDAVHAELERLVGVPLFEIPTIPPGVPGIRLREVFEQQFPARGLTLVPQQKVHRLTLNADTVMLSLQDSYGEVVIEAQTALLATGRFLSGGLVAARDGLREPLLGLPVHQPAHRSDWYSDEYFDPQGHGVNRAGITVDAAYRPLGRDGIPHSERLFAAGILLAHQDWVRQRCGAGLAIATAFRAVNSLAGLLD